VLEMVGKLQHDDEGKRHETIRDGVVDVDAWKMNEHISSVVTSHHLKGIPYHTIFGASKPVAHVKNNNVGAEDPGSWIYKWRDFSRERNHGMSARGGDARLSHNHTRTMHQQTFIPFLVA
jgi:hypothetical protein